jgi:hypothetical protein
MIGNDRLTESSTHRTASSTQSLIESFAWDGLSHKITGCPPARTHGPRNVTDRRDSWTPACLRRGGRPTYRRSCRRADLRTRCAQFRRIWSRGGTDRTAAARCCGTDVHPSDHRGDRHSARHHLHQLPADHRGVSQRRRLLYGRARKPRHERQSAGRGRADDGLRAECRGRNLGRRRRVDLGRTGPSALHADAMPARRARCSCCRPAPSYCASARLYSGAC